MLCPTCHGQRFVTLNGRREPCAECGGHGEVHCCDGLQEQPEPLPRAPQVQQPSDHETPAGPGATVS